MSFTKFTNLDYDQIKESIKDYLRANSDFTGFDFDGSNFSVLIDTLAYNAYINSVNSNMIVNESFLDSATLRRNVVSLAGNIGYLPRSKKASQAKIKFTVQTSSNTPTLTLKAGLVASGQDDGTTYVFSIPEDITALVKDGVAEFGSDEEPIVIYQGQFAKNVFAVNGSVDERYIINNSNMDYSTLIVRVRDANEVAGGKVWDRVDSIVQIDKNSEVYFIAEVNQENYELLFGDGIFGKPLRDGQFVDATYIITDGKDGDGPRNFRFSGSLQNSNGATIIPNGLVTVTTLEGARNGADIESVDSIKYYAPRLYGSQYRAVTPRDYEGLIKEIYPNTESVSVVGGEELNPPQFGNVLISIKPVNGTEVSEFDKRGILDAIKQYSIAGISQRIVDLKVLYVELDTFVYYDVTKVANAESLRTMVTSSLDSYANSVDLNKFGGRFKYSKVQKVIDDTDLAVTSNITRVIIRRNLAAAVNQLAQYELCFGNGFYINPEGGNIKSSGFTIFGRSDTVYITDFPNRDANGNLDGSGFGKISLFTKQNYRRQRKYQYCC